MPAGVVKLKGWKPIPLDYLQNVKFSGRFRTIFALLRALITLLSKKAVRIGGVPVHLRSADRLSDEGLPLVTGRARGTTLLFAICLAIVTLVSVHDAVLIVINHRIIGEFEENPIGSFLLNIQGGQVWLFFCTKLLGTSLVIAVLVTLYEYRRSMGMICVLALSVFQLGLLSYLTFS